MLTRFYISTNNCINLSGFFKIFDWPLQICVFWLLWNNFYVGRLTTWWYHWSIIRWQSTRLYFFLTIMNIIQYIDRSPNIVLIFTSFSRVHIFRKFSILSTFRNIKAWNIILFYLTISDLVFTRNWYWNLFYFVFMADISDI